MPKENTTDDYDLDAQAGYLLRLANQRHTALFQKSVPDGITPTQFSALIRIAEVGDVSQNQLGRLAAMDGATIKGVVDRLARKSLVCLKSDPNDKRRTLISLTSEGTTLVNQLRSAGFAITKQTLAPLTSTEQSQFLILLEKLT